MPKFLFIYRDACDPNQKAPSPQEMQAILEQWGAWIGKFSQSGQIVDPGDGLKPSGCVLRPKGMVSDGPFAEAKEIVGGFSVVSVDSYDAALKIAKECPAVLAGGSIEIREFAGFS